jgi:hypothetical protein
VAVGGGTKNSYKMRKIKENHMILMLTLAKKCLEDGHFGLTEAVLNVRYNILMKL